ncbi:MAG: M20/M25/M40 family metallo-hydrolase, partial [Candidatus Diapherotrites archaeon]|nr:M20/M25/M40 family metallo-hydrolase [Candidatus Diapherotrites archaeon]
MSHFESKKKLREHLINLVTELVRFPSHGDELEKFVPLIRFILSYFGRERVYIRQHNHQGIPSVVISTVDTKHPEILLSGHLDVVPSSRRYIAVAEGPLLYGSGAVDMKGGVAVIMAILKHFSRSRQKPSLGIMLTCDEETGGEHGTRYLLAEEHYRANFVVINEGRRRYDIVTREKGILVLRFRATGNYIHSAYPWQGPNVLEDLMRFCLSLKKLFPKPTDKWAP